MTYLSPQISYLVTVGRPMSVSMGNAIRQLKYEISILDIDLPEQDVSTLRISFAVGTEPFVLFSQAKDLLCERIDHFIRDRIVLADQVIQQLCIDKIHDGDVVLTYARCDIEASRISHDVSHNSSSDRRS